MQKGHVTSPYRVHIKAMKLNIHTKTVLISQKLHKVTLFELKKLE